jgi:hypothetical protein
MKPFPEEEEEESEDMSALSSLMTDESAAAAPEAAAPEATGSPDQLVSELKMKLAELEQSLRGL